MHGNAKQDYNGRQSIKTNLGEELFARWCNEHNWRIDRVGFDEKGSNVPFFYKLNPILRNIPDFVISKNDRIYAVNVKGTANIKRSEVNMLPLLIEAYSTPECPLVYAFCFNGKDPLFLSTARVILLYQRSKDNQWHDGVIYRHLELYENLQEQI